MAAHHKTIEHWSTAPDPAIRKTKAAVEEELLIKLGAKKEVIEFHPLILSSRLERAKSFISMKYSRATPPAKAKSPKILNPWYTPDQALRRMTNPSRRGPRDFMLPILGKESRHVTVEDIPPFDIEYQAKRAAAVDRLTHLLSEWTVYNRRAFPLPVNSHPITEDLECSRKISKETLNQLDRGQPKRSRGSNSTSSDTSQQKANRPVPKSRKKKNRWKDMTQEILLQLKATHMRLPDELPRSELKLYVSSTPDLQEEREFLEEVAYPKLRELCEKLGLNCHVVDMRNGAGILANDLETFDLIEKELKTCRQLSIGPYFVSLIGHKLDDQSLPGFFHKSVYEEIRETLIKENIIGVDAFDDVYRLDSNRVPPVYIKQRIQAVDEYQSPEQVEKILFKALTQAVSIITRTKQDDEQNYADFYKWSAVVKELEEGLLTGYSPGSDTLCFMMGNEVAHKDVTMDDTPIRRLRHRVYNHYRHFASMENLVNFKTGKKTVAYLRSMSDTFIAGVAALLKSQIRHREYDITQQLTEGSEALQHTRIAFSKAEHNIGNDDILDDVRGVLERSDPSPKTVLLWGQSGVGKTSLVSQIAKASVLWQPRRKVVFRCLGSTLRSSSLFRMLESLIRQLDFVYSLNIELPLDLTLQGAVSIFCFALKAVSEKRQLHGDLLLVLDQLEKLHDLDTHYLLCILNSLSEGTTLLLTLQTPHSLLTVLKGHQTVQTISRQCMNEKEISQYVTESLESADRVVTGDQLQCAIYALSTDPTPMYAELIFHIVRWWPSHTLPELAQFSNDPEEDFAVLLKSVESDLGVAFTQHALSLLAVAKFGLGDQELLHLLSKDSELLNKIKEAEEFVSIVEGFPYQLQLSRLISRLGRFLMNIKVEGETVYRISSRPLADAIKSRYMQDAFFYTVHQKLADFFLFIRRGLLLSSKDISEQKHRHLSKYHWRTLRCVPYHLCHSSPDTSSVWESLKEKVFFNFSWLVNEVYAGFLNDLLDDLNYALETVSLDPDIQYLQQLLTAIRHTIVHNPLSLAAVFASQNVHDVDSVKDTVRIVVHDARAWLKQIRLQALVPVSYTPDKISRLIVKESTLFGVTDLKPIPGSGRLLVQRSRSLSILNMLSCEEVPLAILDSDIVALHEEDDNIIEVVTLEIPSTYRVEIFDLQKGKHLKTISLGDTPLLWFEIRPPGIYFAVESGIKLASLDSGSVTTLFPMETAGAISCLSASKPEKLITMSIDEKTKLKSFPLKDVTEPNSVSLKNDTPNKYCFPVLSTKDGKYIIYLTERQASIIETSTFKVMDTYSHKGLPIVKAMLSRSHEHLFMAYANGAITCHVLYSGSEALETKIKPKPKPKQPASQKSRDRNKSKTESGKTDTDEIVKIMITSEDDHFLLCGTNRGHLYVIHVPTGLQLVDVTTEQKAIEKLTYLTDKGHFQHVISTDVEGFCRQWNLRPLFKQARMILQLYIIDNDLLKEEEIKLDLNGYFTIYEARKDNRIFLNGPDIAAFYQEPPTDIFADLAELDPAFGVLNDWEITGKIADLNDHLLAVVCGSELGDVVLTVSSDFRLARWSLRDGSLVWSKRIDGQGETIHDMASVYYDQAVLLVQQSRLGHGFGVSVIYTGEGQHKVMSRDNVTCYWASVDRTRVILMCQGTAPFTDTKLFSWDLINAKEELCDFVHNVSSMDTQTFMTFSPSLLRNVSLSVPPDSQANVSHKLSSTHGPLKSYRSAPDPDLDHFATDSASTFDMCDSPDLRPSVPHGATCDVRPLPGDTPNTCSSLETPPTSPETASPKPMTIVTQSPKLSTKSDTEETKDHQDDVLTKYTTQIHWTKVCIKSEESGNVGGKPAKPNQDKKAADPASRTPSGKIPIRHSSLSDTSKKPENAYSSGQRRHDAIKEETGDVHKNTEDEQKHRNMNQFEYLLKLQVTAICFVGENALCVGTSSRHVFLFNVPSFQPIYALGMSGSSAVDELSEKFLKSVITPHTSVITFVAASDDTRTLISSDGNMICVWEVESRTLRMKISIETDQEVCTQIRKNHMSWFSELNGN